MAELPGSLPSSPSHADSDSCCSTISGGESNASGDAGMPPVDEVVAAGKGKRKEDIVDDGVALSGNKGQIVYEENGGKLAHDDGQMLVRGETEELCDKEQGMGGGVHIEEGCVSENVSDKSLAGKKKGIVAFLDPEKDSDSDKETTDKEDYGASDEMFAVEHIQLQDSGTQHSRGTRSRTLSGGAGSSDPEKIAETVDQLFQAYDRWISVVVVTITAASLAVCAYAIFGYAFSLESNIPQITAGKNSNEMQVLGQYRMYNFVSTTWEGGQYASCIFICALSLVWPVIQLCLLLVVWFAPLTLRSRSRVIRWLSRLGSAALFFFYYIVFMDALIQVSYVDSGNNYRVLRGRPLGAVYAYLIVVLTILFMAEWIYVLHYNNSAYLVNEKHAFKFQVDSYFGDNNFCSYVCCANWLKAGPITTATRKKQDDDLFYSQYTMVSRRNVVQGWQFASSHGSNNMLIKTIATDMEFIRGMYKYACSTFGVVMALVWLVAITAFGALCYSLPVLGIEGSISGTGFDGVARFPETQTIILLGRRIVSEPSVFQTDSTGLFFLAAFYYILVTVAPISLHIIITLVLFSPVEKVFGKRTLRGLCHAANIISPLASLDIAVISVAVFSFDFTGVFASLLSQGITNPNNTAVIFQNSTTSSICYTISDGTVFCLDITFRAGIVFGLLFIAFSLPYLYYFAETYHRHFGLIADGRNDQTYKSGETTHKHRAEGCIVYACYLCRCCTRKEYTFRQESVDEGIYYGDGVSGSLFIPEGLYDNADIEKNDGSSEHVHEIQLMERKPDSTEGPITIT